MTTRKLVELLKPGLSLMLTATLALGQQVPVPNNGATATEAPAAREKSATWGSFKPETHEPNAARDLATYREKGAPEAIQADDEIDVIVQYRQNPEQNPDQNREQNILRAVKRGAKMKALLGEAVLARMTRQAAIDLSSDPNVYYVSPDRQLTGTLDITRQAVNASAAQLAGWIGTGVGVAVIDSGVDGRDGMAQGQQVVYSQNFVPSASDAIDRYGHGTHVAGIIAGSGSQSGGKYKGLANGANIINLRVLDANAQGSDSQVIAAIDRAIALKTTYNIRVINLSLGRPVFESYKLDPLCQAAERAWKAGIVVVVAAGNEGRNNTYGNKGYGTISAPGNDPYVITVGGMKTMGTASRTDDRVASYSSKGPSLFDHIVKPDIMAPGNRMVSVKLNSNSLMESQYPANEVSGDYFILSGSSMAAPMVSAAAAILLHKQPSLTPDQVKARLMKTASKGFPVSSTAVDPATNVSYTSYYDVFTIGAGYLDISAALANTNALTGNALSPTAVYNTATDNGTLQFATGSGIGGTNVVWGTNLVWGTNVVWGTSLVWGTSIVWGSNVVWGTNTNGTTGFNVVWGENIVWGSNTTTAAERTGVVINGEN